MDVSCMYNVQIQGDAIDQPLDLSLELPEWLGDLAIAAQKTKAPDGVQEAALTVVLARATELYRDFMDDPFVVLKPSDIVVRKLGSEQ